MTDAPATATGAVMEALAAHRWKSMGVASVECECGVVICGDASLTQFPADEAFRSHLAVAVLTAAANHLVSDDSRARKEGYAAGRAAQREADAWLAEERHAVADCRRSDCELAARGWPHREPFAAFLRQGGPAATEGTA